MEYSPLKQNERIGLIDALRGFALFGILMVNMLIMYEPVTQIVLGAKPDASISHIIGQSFIKFFFEGKFYVIFSMLFGFGFYIFMNKSDDNSISAVPVFRRRLFFLLLFGLAHIILLWAGDILLLYSLIGFILILFRKASDKKIIRWATALALIPPILISLMTLGVMFGSQVPEVKVEMDIQFQNNVAQMEALAGKATLIYSTGSFSEIVTIRIKEYLSMLGGVIVSLCPVVLAMFLIGFLAARRGIISNYMNNLQLFRKVFWWGLSVGVVASLLYTVSYHRSILLVPDGWSLLASSMHTIGGISLGLCYISGIAILYINGKSKFFTKYFAPVGRMALTNYLLQSIITALLFHSYGLALFGKVQVWQGIILTITIFAMQIVFSRWWLNHFQFGPFEWLWRSMTYLKFQPMTRSIKTHAMAEQ